MKRILLTGASGFVGKNILPVLSSCYDVLTPNRGELNLFDSQAVQNYVKNNNVSYIVHCASPSPMRGTGDVSERVLRDMLMMYSSIADASRWVEKIIYMGSGAEFDKSRDIIHISEERFGESIPKDDYGFAKYILNKMTLMSENIYNLRLFGCYGPGDYPEKFITHAIRASILNVPVTIRKDCYFDYLHVHDLGVIVKAIIEGTPKYHDYNACSGERILLSDIARRVINNMGTANDIRILSDEKGFEYTGSNQRLLSEFDIDFAYPLDEGIKAQINWEKDNWSESTVFDGE